MLSNVAFFRQKVVYSKKKTLNTGIVKNLYKLKVFCLNLF